MTLIIKPVHNVIKNNYIVMSKVFKGILIAKVSIKAGTVEWEV